MNERDKVIKFAFDEIKKRIIDEKTSMPDSLSFCKLVLDSMPNNKDYIISYFNNKYNEVLSEISSQNDFVKALKIFDLFLAQDSGISRSILRKTTEKFILSLRNMPDDLWKVRVLSQLSEKVLNIVLPELTIEELNSLLYICPQVVNSETVEKVTNQVVENKKTSKKLILRKKR